MVKVQFMLALRCLRSREAHTPRAGPDRPHQSHSPAAAVSPHQTCMSEDSLHVQAEAWLVACHRKCLCFRQLTSILCCIYLCALTKADTNDRLLLIILRDLDRHNMRESDDMLSWRVSVISTSRITLEDLSVYKRFRRSKGESTRAFIYVDSRSIALKLVQIHRQQI